MALCCQQFFGVSRTPGHKTPSNSSGALLKCCGGSGLVSYAGMQVLTRVLCCAVKLRPMRGFYTQAKQIAGR